MGGACSRRLVQFVTAHVAVCTLIAVGGLWTGPIQDDMAEAWAWGREFQLGYAKHPPFFAWVAGAWFLLFPRLDWCFYLLSAVNGAIGLAGVWFLAGRFLQGRARLAAVLLTGLVPLQTIVAINYNASSALLSSWPWAVYFFVRSMESCRIGHGLLFGVLAAMALLTKYFSALLLLSCFVASLFHPHARRYYRSPAPYAAVAAFLVLIAPHVHWAMLNDLPTVQYALLKTWQPRISTSYRVVIVTLMAVGIHGLMLLGLLRAFGRATPHLLRGALLSIKEPHRAWIWTLALGPFVLMLISVLVFNVKLNSKFLTPLFFLVPTALLAFSCADVTAQRLRSIARLWALAACACAIVGLPLSYAMFRLQLGLAQEPSRELARAATDVWHHKFGTPLRIVAASRDYGHALAFYSADAPSHFIDASYVVAPWVTPARVEREGLLVACRLDDAACLERAAKFESRHSIREQVSVFRSHMGYNAPSIAFVLILIPPSGQHAG